MQPNWFTRLRVKLWPAVACLLGSWAILPGMAAAAPKAAAFERGKDVEVVSLRVGPQGATLNAGQSGSPIDGLVVEIPPGALKREITVKLLYNTGKLSLPKGQGSGIFLGLSADEVREFEKPVTIRIRYDASRHQCLVVVGYAIDNKGRLRAVNSGAQDVKAGTASFSTLIPLLFTWVYN
jgi:hypothetical protein